MSGIFITSDEHYGHANIIKFCKRPFADITEMREELIRRHNAKVPKNSNVVTIHLGDMFWRTVPVLEARMTIARLNGSHAFIYGNHDELIAGNESLEGMFQWVEGSNKASGTRIIKWNGHEITLCHYAMTVWDNSHRGSWQLYGHSHGELRTFGKSFDIGVDCHNFEPWSMEEIEAEMAKRPQGHVIPPAKLWRTDEEGTGNRGSGGDVALA